MSVQDVPHCLCFRGQGRRAADNLTGQPRQQVLALCDEVDGLSRQLADLVRRGQGNTPQAQALAKSVSHRPAPDTGVIGLMVLCLP